MAKNNKNIKPSEDDNIKSEKPRAVNKVPKTTLKEKLRDIDDVKRMLAKNPENTEIKN